MDNVIILSTIRVIEDRIGRTDPTHRDAGREIRCFLFPQNDNVVHPWDSFPTMGHGDYRNPT